MSETPQNPGQPPAAPDATIREKPTLDELASAAQGIDIAYRGDPQYEEQILKEQDRIGVVLDAIQSEQIPVELGKAILTRLAAELRMASGQDSLTGLLERQTGLGQLERIISVGLRSETKQTTSAIFIDADHFKLVNDHAGHNAGDKVLAEAGNHLKNNLKRDADIALRYGGDEFVIGLAGSNIDGAVQVAEGMRTSTAEAIRNALEESGIENVPERVTFSLGVAEINLDDTRKAEEIGTSLVEDAESASRVAKLLGKDRVVKSYFNERGKQLFQDVITKQDYTVERDEEGKVSKAMLYVDPYKL